MNVTTRAVVPGPLTRRTLSFSLSRLFLRLFPNENIYADVDADYKAPRLLGADFAAFCMLQYSGGGKLEKNSSQFRTRIKSSAKHVSQLHCACCSDGVSSFNPKGRTTGSDIICKIIFTVFRFVLMQLCGSSNRSY